MVKERKILDYLESIPSGIRERETACDRIYEMISPRLIGNINIVREYEIKISLSHMAGKNFPLRYLIKTDQELIEWLNKLIDSYQNYSNVATLVFCSIYNLEPDKVRDFLRVSTFFNTYHDESRWLKINECLEKGETFLLSDIADFLRHIYGFNISYEQVKANSIDVLITIVNSDISLDFTRASQGVFTNNDIIAMGFTHEHLREHYRPVLDGMTKKETNKFLTEYGDAAFCTRRLMEDTYRYRVVDFLRREIMEEGVN